RIDPSVMTGTVDRTGRIDPSVMTGTVDRTGRIDPSVMTGTVDRTGRIGTIVEMLGKRTIFGLVKDIPVMIVLEIAMIQDK
ncbi:hypothetical protein ACQCN2_02470, partial [Brevibacillus ginsengisoli]|uniref:hypothetical protein n=1 Tax=Brevibacillus ginsengisoli TaxID=363854 RepID=UPI003CF3BEFF